LTFIAPLTSLRFLAAAAVAIFHLQGAFGYHTGNINFAPAITFFFVLSGFVLTHAYEDFPDESSVVRYYVSRFARLWPLHLMTALYFLWFIYTPPLKIVLANLLLVQSWSMELVTAMAMNGVSWSISVEVFFYFIFPAVIVTRRYWALWLMASVAVVVFAGAMATLTGETGEHLTGAAWLSFLHVGPPARFLEFLAGVLTALFFRRHPQIKLPVQIWTVLELLALALAAFFCRFEPFTSFANANLPVALACWLLYSGTFPIMCVVVLCFAYSGGVISRILSLKPFVFLGDISFAVYMVHQLVLVVWLQQGWAPNAWDPFALCLIFAQIACISVLSFIFVEKPAKAALIAAAMRLQRAKWWRRPSQPGSTSTRPAQPGL